MCKVVIWQESVVDFGIVVDFRWDFIWRRCWVCEVFLIVICWYFSIEKLGLICGIKRVFYIAS
jgi:hypothetical protein